MKKKTQKLAVLLAAAMSFGGIYADLALAETKAVSWEEAASLPYTPYPETVNYTLGKMTGADRSNMPDEDTYEDNAYTRYLKNMLNVQNVDMFEAQDNQYHTNVEMCIATGNLPDVMVVGDRKVLQRLVRADLIEDLSAAYEACASDTLKEMYDSYGEEILADASFNGKLMALPETNINNGPNLLWLRRDWMDKLGLEAPKTLDDAISIIRAFIEQDPGENGEGRTVGLVCDTALSGGNGYSAEYMTDIIFACYGAYPKQWIYDEKGEVCYGSVQPNAKEALAKLNEMYEEGILDQNFLLRSSNNLKELIQNGQCGSFFGPWWAPNNPLMEAIEANPEAVWEPFLIATDEDGSTSYHSQNPSYKYVVVRKGYEHPEIVFKIASVMFDYIRFEDSQTEEFVRYFQQNVDPTARPLSINVDYKDALAKCYNSIRAALNGELDPDKLEMLERSYYDSCLSYMKNPKTATKEEWAAYASRIQACALISEGKTKEVASLFFGTTLAMSENWWRLEDLEEEAYLKIVTGEVDIDYFDTFVLNWHKEGGTAVTAEVRARFVD